MAKTIMDLFKEKKSEIFTPSAIVFLETKGIVNPQRVTALGLSSPTRIGDLIGNTLNATAGRVTKFFGGNATRPDDLIFRDNKPLSKPITLLAPTNALLQQAVQPNTSYYVKTSPTPKEVGLLNRVAGAVGNPAATQRLGISLLNTYGNKKGWEKFGKLFKNSGPANSTYGPEEMEVEEIDDENKKKSVILNQDYNYSKWYKDQNKKLQERIITKGTTKPGKTQKPILDKSKWELINTSIITAMSDDAIKKITEDNETSIKTPYVRFESYGSKNIDILLPGTITGFSEDFQPAVNGFKYVGSPFTLYRYGGVERSIKFSMKLYFETEIEKKAIHQKLDYIKQMVFPDENISAITYENNAGYSQLAFNPNILYITINGLYYKIPVIIDTLGISIDDNIPWVSGNVGVGGELFGKPYPSTFDVAFSMKIIETTAIDNNKYLYGKSNNLNNKYSSYFTKYDKDGDTTPIMKVLTPEQIAMASSE